MRVIWSEISSPSSGEKSADERNTDAEAGFGRFDQHEIVRLEGTRDRDDGDIFLSIGPLLPRKDPLTVVRGFLRSNAASEAYLVQVSGGPLLERCRRAADRSERVFLPGRVPRVEPYVRAADYFVSASHAEGLPLAVLEALAAGVPVCLSDIPPHEEILELGPQSGLAFAEGSPAGLASGIDRLRADGEGRRAAARRTAVDRLSAVRMADRYRRLYDRIT